MSAATLPANLREAGRVYHDPAFGFYAAQVQELLDELSALKGGSHGRTD